MTDNSPSVESALIPRVEAWMDVLFVGLSPELLSSGTLPRNLTTVRQGGSIPGDPWDAVFFRFDARSAGALKSGITRARGTLRHGGVIGVVALPPLPKDHKTIEGLVADVEPEIVRTEDGALLAFGRHLEAGRQDLVGLRRNVRSLLDRVSAVEGLIANVRESASGRRPVDGGWSVKELVGHLGDIDRFGYLTRLQAVRNGRVPKPLPDWEAEAARLDHNGRPLAELAVRYRHFRYQSMELLESLTEEDWLITGKDADGRETTLADLVRTWVRDETRVFEELEGRVR